LKSYDSVLFSDYLDSPTCKCFHKQEAEHSRIAGHDANEIYVTVRVACRRINKLRYSDEKAKSKENVITLLERF